jgi:hypothetical protein
VTILTESGPKGKPLVYGKVPAWRGALMRGIACGAGGMCCNLDLRFAYLAVPVAEICEGPRW